MRSVAYIWTVLAVPLAHVRADEPTLARLSFWVPPERMAEFEAAYEEQVVPILKKHGLVESSERGRATADSFSRLFAVENPTAATIKKEHSRKTERGRTSCEVWELRSGQGVKKDSFAIVSGSTKPQPERARPYWPAQNTGRVCGKTSVARMASRREEFLVSWRTEKAICGSPLMAA